MLELSGDDGTGEAQIPSASAQTARDPTASYGWPFVHQLQAPDSGSWIILISTLTDCQKSRGGENKVVEFRSTRGGWLYHVNSGRLQHLLLRYILNQQACSPCPRRSWYNRETQLQRMLSRYENRLRNCRGSNSRCSKVFSFVCLEMPRWWS